MLINTVVSKNKSSLWPFLLTTGMLVSITIPSEVSAHDIWIVTNTYRIGPAEGVSVFINNGDFFPESNFLLGRHRVKEFFMYEGDSRQEIQEFQKKGQSLEVLLSPNGGGIHILALSVEPRVVRLRSAEFTDYLEENGLVDVLDLRERLGESDEATMERYSKWAKAIIEVASSEAGGSNQLWSESVGHTFEIVPRKNPYRMRAGEVLPVTVFFKGKPVSGATIKAGTDDSGVTLPVVATNENGHAEIRLVSKGRWYFRALHLIRLDDDPVAQWESFWSTLTFQIF